MNDGFCFRIKLKILLSLFTVYVDRLLYYLTSGQAFSLLLSEIENLVAFPVQFGTYRISNQSRSTVFVCSHLKLHRHGDDAAVPCIDGYLHDGSHFTCHQLLFHFHG